MKIKQIERPGKIVAVGLNYRDHAEELGIELPSEPCLFLKPPSAVIWDGDSIIYPPQSSRIDFEAELAIVIKKTARNIKRDEVADYILGYTCANDVTARDLQKKDCQWARAKSFDSFCPIGPVVTDDISPDDVNVKLYLNGELKQDANTRDFIFKTDELVSFISGIMTLMPNDIILTGTPKGIGPLKIGDKVEVEIPGIGVLTNYVRKD